MNTSLRVSAVVLAVATVGAVASTGADALQGRQLFAMRAAPPEAAPVAAHSNGTPLPVQAKATGAAEADSVPEIAAPLATAPSPAEPGVSAPIVAEGRTELGDGLFAVREGRSVTVYFDVPQARTRRRDKFDRIVRTTLPRIYGPVAQANLDQIPQGEIVKVGMLPAELEKSGVRIPLGDSTSIALWPEVRDANGGPLVIGYRAEVAR